MLCLIVSLLELSGGKMMSQNEIGSADTTTLWRLSDILRRGSKGKNILFGSEAADVVQLRRDHGVTGVREPKSAVVRESNSGR